MRWMLVVVALLAIVPFSYQNAVRSAETQDSEVLIEGVQKDPNLIGFYLFPNSRNVADLDELKFDDVDSVRNSRYNPNKRLILYSSGFMQNLTTDQVIKDAYLRAGFASNANIVIIEWGHLSGNKATIPNTFVDLFIINLYSNVKSNAPVVGKRVFEFIQFLESSGLLPLGPESVHIVGQSMGAHIAGIAGLHYNQATGKLIGRITGTDAAGPLFQGINKNDRLGASDAIFVDSLHTNDGGYGYSGAFATADFLVNGGKAPQPGCDGTEAFCSHNLAVEYFAKSILDPTIRAFSVS